MKTIDHANLREVLTEEFLEDLNDEFHAVHEHTKDEELIPVHMTKRHFSALIDAAIEGMKVVDAMRRWNE